MAYDKMLESERKFDEFVAFLKEQGKYKECFGNLSLYVREESSAYEYGYDGVPAVPVETIFIEIVRFKGEEIYNYSSSYAEYSDGFSSRKSSYKKLDESEFRRFILVSNLTGERIKMLDKIKSKLDIKKKEETNNKEVVSNATPSKKDKKKIKEALDTIKNKLVVPSDKIDEKSMLHTIRIDESILITTVGDHREFRKEFEPYLKYIDLGFVSCKNIKISGLDLSEANLRIDPHQVYKKDLSGASISMDSILSKLFEGCNVEGCNIYGFPIEEKKKSNKKEK